MSRPGREDAPGSFPAERDRARIRALADEGRLTRAEAELLLRASADGGAGAGAAANGADARRLRFLRGQVDAAELWRADRAAAARMGALFGVGMLLAVPPLLAVASPGHATGFYVACGALQLLLGGPLFGWLMHRSVLRPRTERLMALAAEHGAPLGPVALADTGHCPTCGAADAGTWGPRSWTVRHWVWNPGLAFNELVLGQRIPRELHLCRRCGTHFVDCEDCDRSFDASRWRARDGFGRWRGLRCPECAGPIPVERNALAAFLERSLRGRAPHGG